MSRCIASLTIILTLLLAGSASAQSGDTQSPTTPSNLRLLSSTQTSITVGWDASTDDTGIKSYSVWYQPAGGSWTSAGRPTATQTTISGLKCGTSAVVDVYAIDNADKWSAAARKTFSAASCATTPPPPTDTPPATGTGLGGSVVDLSWGISSSDATRTYQELKAAGSKAIRVGFGWRSLESSKGSYNSSKLAQYDDIVSRARAAGQRVIFNVVDTPGWANGGQGANVPPSDVNSIQPFIRDMAARYYDRGVEAFEIWNEQDTSRFWNPVSPSKYAALLRASYTAAKAARPKLKIATGGTSGNDWNFWNAAYNAGIHGYFDVMALHPYTGKGDPTVSWTNSAGRIDEWAFNGYREIRKLMLSKGDDKPIWFTEFGWSSANNGGWADVGPTKQADYITKAFRILRQDPYVEIAFHYMLRDGDWSIDNSFGLFSLNWTKKPAWTAYRNANP